MRALADHHHHPRDIGAAVSSGSFVTLGMLVVRAADVCLKERRRVVLLLRETPLHAGHIDLMARPTNTGAIVMPPVPAFYTLPRSLEDVVDHTVSRALELLDVVVPGIKRWDGRSVVPDEG
ncbi:flavoprotein [Mycobacterium sp. URHB0021]